MTTFGEQLVVIILVGPVLTLIVGCIVWNTNLNARFGELEADMDRWAAEFRRELPAQQDPVDGNRKRTIGAACSGMSTKRDEHDD